MLQALFAGKFSRKQTGASDWEFARAIVGEWERAESWGESPKAPVPPEAPARDGNRTTVEDATAAYVASRSNRGVSGPTIKKYNTFVN
jgi:hypothetical protein